MNEETDLGIQFPFNQPAVFDTLFNAVTDNGIIGVNDTVKLEF